MSILMLGRIGDETLLLVFGQRDVDSGLNVRPMFKPQKSCIHKPFVQNIHHECPPSFKVIIPESENQIDLLFIHDVHVQV